MLADKFAFHRENTDLQVWSAFFLKCLVIPNDLVHREGNLLVRFVLNNIWNSLWSDGG